jgi:hypothetical protein
MPSRFAFEIVLSDLFLIIVKILLRDAPYCSVVAFHAQHLFIAFVSPSEVAFLPIFVTNDCDIQ